ncbi:caspase family protein [Nonomuraea sp. NPDC050451]|uniref:caspase, EACC1-associated type n=1 Tax=Nonomuraea sp. NPDC050451 TaxID=3364364 RepID=UPI0037A19787
MTGMLATPGVRALLVGSQEYAAESIFNSVAAVRPTLAALEDCLVRRAGLDRAHLVTLLDPANPMVVGDALVAAADAAPDVLLFYYVGHGFVGPDNQLHLATKATFDPARGVAAHQALPYSVIRDVLKECPARLIVIILDCCFSARASGPFGQQAADAFNVDWRHGTYLLTATERDQAAWAPPGAPYTAFTGELVRILSEGDPRAPHEFTLDALYRSLGHALERKGLPRPSRQAIGASDGLVLAANPAYRSPVPPALPPPVDAAGFGPYQGLAAFGPADARLFFGREKLTLELRERVLDRPPDSVPLAVIGASGSGKSSLIGAGLLPQLMASGRPHLLLTPGEHPLRRLAERLPAPDDANHVLERFKTDPLSLRDLVRGPHGAERPVVIVDQFEEVFTTCPNEEERQAFVEALGVLSRPASGQRAVATVVISLRADYYGHCTRFPELVAALRKPVVVGPMTAAQLREVIVKPAELSGLALQDGLADLLLKELGATADTAANPRAALPLLSHALLATWQHREGRVLTLAGYHATGGIGHAIAATADATLAALDEDGRRMARWLLLRLVHLHEGVEDTRKVAALDELLPAAGHADHDAARRALQAFVASRLVTVDADTVQIAHEALIRGWPQLRSWIDVNRADLLVRQQLSEDAAAWQDHGRDAAYLYTDTRLDAARQATVGLDPADLRPLETSFLEAGVRFGRRRVRTVRQVIAALTVLLVTATAASVYAFLQGQNAQRERDSALSKQVSGVGAELTDPTLGAQVSLAAYRVAPTAEARGAVLSTLSHPVPTRVPATHGHAYGVAYSRDGRQAATAYADGTVQLWDVADRTRVRGLGTIKANAERVPNLAYSSGGGLLATVSFDDRARLWDVSDPAHPRLTATLTGHRDNVIAAAFSPGDRVLVTSSSDLTGMIWDLANPSRPRLLATVTHKNGDLRDLAFSPDGRTLAAASSDTTVRLWNMSDPARPKALPPLKGHVNAVSSVAFSPDGSTLATASEDWGVTLWDVTNPAKATKKATFWQTDRVYGVAFSPDGRTLAEVGASGLASLWDVTDRANPQRLATLTGHLAEVQGVAFSPDGTALATVSSDGTLRLWDVVTPRSPAALPTLGGHADGVDAVALSANGRLAVTGSDDRTARIWDVSNASQPVLLSALRPENNFVTGVSLSPDGKTLAIACGCGLGRLWDITDPRKPVLAATLRSSTTRVDAIGYAPNGRVLAIACGCGALQMWDVSAPKQPKLLLDRVAHQDAAWDLAFSPDGGILATASADRTVKLWNAADPARLPWLADIPAHALDVNSVAFSPDGHLLATGSTDETARIWDVTRPAEPAMLVALTGHSAAVRGVAFSTDGRMLATASDDQTVRLWTLPSPRSPNLWAILRGHRQPVHDVAFTHGRQVVTAAGDGTAQFWGTDLATAERRICERRGRPIAEGEWLQYLPNVPYADPCAK